MKTPIKSSMRSTRAKMKFIGRVPTWESGSWDKIRRQRRAMCRSIPVQKNGTASTALKFRAVVISVLYELRKRLPYELVVPAWTAGTQVDMDVSERILRAWIPAIHAGMTDAAVGQNVVKYGCWRGGMSPYFHALRRA